jgi:hypothetical protein
MPESEPPQTPEHGAEVVIFDVYRRSIQPLRRTGGEAVDFPATLASCSAQAVSGRM